MTLKVITPVNVDMDTTREVARLAAELIVLTPDQRFAEIEWSNARGIGAASERNRRLWIMRRAEMVAHDDVNTGTRFDLVAEYLLDLEAQS